ncbi:hypothetical protein ACOBR2_13880 [Telmatobacter bradus]|uniref:hypothetical protein n=1 Tax=Telmatobacter bradus TaxID=474953 RepID=UPI003B43622B
MMVAFQKMKLGRAESVLGDIFPGSAPRWNLFADSVRAGIIVTERNGTPEGMMCVAEFVVKMSICSTSGGTQPVSDWSTLLPYIFLTYC